MPNILSVEHKYTFLSPKGVQKGFIFLVKLATYCLASVFLQRIAEAL